MFSNKMHVPLVAIYLHETSFKINLIILLEEKFLITL